MSDGLDPRLALGALGGLLLAAIASDLRSRRIPNRLVLAGIALGLVFQALTPPGHGLFGAPGFGATGFAAAALGGLTGLALLLPMWLLRALGAGDVKLLAMAGVWLGVAAVARSALYTLLAGGLLSLGWALASRQLGGVLVNLRAMLFGSWVRAQAGQGIGVVAPAQTTGRLPYAIAIACGVSCELAVGAGGWAWLTRGAA